jgi:hypothetical protein
VVACPAVLLLVVRCPTVPWLVVIRGVLFREVHLEQCLEELREPSLEELQGLYQEEHHKLYQEGDRALLYLAVQRQEL